MVIKYMLVSGNDLIHDASTIVITFQELSTDPTAIFLSDIFMRVCGKRSHIKIIAVS